MAGGARVADRRGGIDEFWQTVDLADPDSAITRMRRLIDELELDDAVARFKLASIYDALGFEDDAVVEYEAARSARLSGARLAQSTVQYDSTLRNLGRTQKAITYSQAPSHIHPLATHESSSLRWHYTTQAEHRSAPPRD